MQQEQIKFTPMEREIIALIKSNPSLTNPELEELLFFAPGSIRNNLVKIYKKAGIETRRGINARPKLNQWIKENM